MTSASGRTVFVAVIATIAARLVAVAADTASTHEPFLAGRAAFLLAVLIAFAIHLSGRTIAGPALACMSACVFATALAIKSGNLAGEPFVFMVVIIVLVSQFTTAPVASAVSVAVAVLAMIVTGLIATTVITGRTFEATSSAADSGSYIFGLVAIIAVVAAGNWTTFRLFSELQATNENLRAEVVERTAIAGQLEASQAELEATFDSAPIGLATMTGDGTLVRHNQALPGLSNAVGEGGPAFAFVTPSDRAQCLAALKEVAAGGNMSESLVVRLHEHRAGESEVHIRLRRIQHTGTGQAIVASVENVSEQRQLERQIERQHRQRSLGILAGGIAHDFNNLLTAVQAHVTVAQQRGQDDDTAGHLDKALAGTRRAAELTRQLLTYAGNEEPSVELFSINAVIEDTIGLLEVTTPHGVSLRCKLDDSSGLIRANRGRIQQAVMNLVLNASRSMEDRPGTIWLETVAADFDMVHQTNWQVQELDHRNTSYVRLEVRDEGTGIDPAVIGRIFDPFFRSDSTGHGLGLAVVTGIVVSNNGAMRVESEVGIGTNACLVFPTVASSAHA